MVNENKKPGILEDLFLRDKPAKILLSLKTAKDSVYATILSKEADCTYSHTIKILGILEKLGIVKSEKSGRIRKVVLTDDGWDIAHNLEAIIKKFKQIESSRSQGNRSGRKKSKKVKG